MDLQAPLQPMTSEERLVTRKIPFFYLPEFETLPDTRHVTAKIDNKGVSGFPKRTSPRSVIGSYKPDFSGVRSRVNSWHNTKHMSLDEVDPLSTSMPSGIRSRETPSGVMRMREDKMPGSPQFNRRPRSADPLRSKYNGELCSMSLNSGTRQLRTRSYSDVPPRVTTMGNLSHRPGGGSVKLDLHHRGVPVEGVRSKVDTWNTTQPTHTGEPFQLPRHTTPDFSRGACSKLDTSDPNPAGHRMLRGPPSDELVISIGEHLNPRFANPARPHSAPSRTQHQQQQHQNRNHHHQGLTKSTSSPLSKAVRRPLVKSATLPDFQDHENNDDSFAMSERVDETSADESAFCSKEDTSERLKDASSTNRVVENASNESAQATKAAANETQTDSKSVCGVEDLGNVTAALDHSSVTKHECNDRKNKSGQFVEPVSHYTLATTGDQSDSDGDEKTLGLMEEVEEEEEEGEGEGEGEGGGRRSSKIIDVEVNNSEAETTVVLVHLFKDGSRNPLQIQEEEEEEEEELEEEEEEGEDVFRCSRSGSLLGAEDTIMEEIEEEEEEEEGGEEGEGEEGRNQRHGSQGSSSSIPSSSLTSSLRSKLTTSPSFNSNNNNTAILLSLPTVTCEDECGTKEVLFQSKRKYLGLSPTSSADTVAVGGQATSDLIPSSSHSSSLPQEKASVFSLPSSPPPPLSISPNSPPPLSPPPPMSPNSLSPTSPSPSPSPSPSSRGDVDVDLERVMEVTVCGGGGGGGKGRGVNCDGEEEAENSKMTML